MWGGVGVVVVAQVSGRGYVRVYCCGYQHCGKTKVDCYRIAYLLLAYQPSFRMQFFAMTAFILRVLFLIPVGGYGC